MLKYKLLRSASLVLFFGGICASPWMGLYSMILFPFAGMVGFMISIILED